MGVRGAKRLGGAGLVASLLDLKRRPFAHGGRISRRPPALREGEDLRHDGGVMRLPFDPPVAPMLSSAADALPAGDGWLFEPKWDGFRTLVFRDGEDILLQSRDEKPMNRYFPELIAPLAAALPERC